MPAINLNGKTINYTIRESKRAKRISMRVDIKKGLEVVYPAGVKKPSAEEILTQNSSWVLEMVGRLETRLETRFAREYQHGEIFRYLGEDRTLNIIQKTHGKTITVNLTDTSLDVSLPSEAKPTDTDILQDAIEKFYRTQAKNFLPKRTYEIATQLGYEVNRVVIKNQKTRWGSCSTNKNINLNLRLMMTPHDAIDYIIIHELCHLTHMDHSKAFWNLVGTHCPRYKYWRKWFKQNNEYLVL